MKVKISCVSDRRLEKVLIRECGEPLVNIREYNKDILIDIEKESRTAQNLEPDTCFVRESVAIKISQAQSLLPEGVKIKVIDGFRPLSAQRKIYKQVFEEIKEKYPSWTEKQVGKETDKWVANPKMTPPHCTGAAIDLILVNEKGKELDFGTSINTSSPKAAMKYPFISPRAKKNRELLNKTLRQVDFRNYPLEWWHWSYGDRIWAYYEKKEHAIYLAKE
ncbi:M15 family metallopeptidase [Candidatus Woesearchaeota archaeon]|nr:M15 family metallopeptidase [Candidatus Woesearchaeota archaeon]